ncbi:hypothetical protein CK203_102887 [Vitis vinifera]|uniref:Uncharacterized protein n=1 Tax=Vitis vinifera TaxID=29760 RepID=A0A438C5J0_VITVI|nr:hypothetical protein CK203_102887 [Vitis vinifera]
MVTDETVPHASQILMHLKQHRLFHLGFHLVLHSIWQIIMRPFHHLLSQCHLPSLLLLMILDWPSRRLRDGISAASLPAKFRMPDIEHYSGIGCPKIHLRLYSTVMRAHKIDDAQLVALFPMSLSGADKSWRPPDRGQMSLFLPLSFIRGQRISGVWFRQLSVLRRPLLEDYGHILFILLQ